MSDDSHYTRAAGQQYFAQRQHCRSDQMQAESAGLVIPHLRGAETVLDFGCGTGGILSLVPCSRRLGVEVSEPASAEARSRGIEVYGDISQVPDQVADAVMSHHALEHVTDPFAVLRELYRVLQPGGRIVLVVPAEEPRTRGNRHWRPNEPQHLYSWNPLTMGNLLRKAGFELEQSYVHEGGGSRFLAWLRGSPTLYRGAKTLYAWLRSRWNTVCVGRRPG